jgi:hypothetical protein
VRATARVLRLQRSAGNHAVATALLQRMTAGDVKKLKGDDKTRHDAAKEKYNANFGFDKPLYAYPSLDDWDCYVEQAENASELAQAIDKLVVAATAWKQREDQRVAEAETPVIRASIGDRAADGDYSVGKTATPRPRKKKANQKVVNTLEMGAATYSPPKPERRPRSPQSPICRTSSGTSRTR